MIIKTYFIENMNQIIDYINPEGTISILGFILGTMAC